MCSQIGDDLILRDFLLATCGDVSRWISCVYVLACVRLLVGDLLVDVLATTIRL